MIDKVTILSGKRKKNNKINKTPNGGAILQREQSKCSQVALMATCLPLTAITPVTKWHSLLKT